MWLTIQAAIMPCDYDSARAWDVRSIMNLPQLAHELPTQSDLFPDKDCARSMKDVPCIQQRMQRRQSSQPLSSLSHATQNVMLG